MLDCPVCLKKNVSEEKCPQCGTDLSPVFRLKELPESYYNEGLLFIREGKLDEAIEKFTAAISLNPDSVDFLVVLGKAYAQKALYDESLSHLERALEIDPENEEVKRTKEKVLEARNLSIKAKTSEKRRLGLFKWLLVGVPVVAFIIGLMIIPLLRTIKKPSPPIDYAVLAEKLGEEINNHSSFAGLGLDVSYKDEVISVSGDVPSEVHKDLVSEIAVNTVNRESLDLKCLSITPTAPEPEKKQTVLYKVRRGDSLAQIAYSFYGDILKWKNIYTANKDNIADPNKIYIGQILLIPIE